MSMAIGTCDHCGARDVPVIITLAMFPERETGYVSKDRSCGQCLSDREREKR